MSRETIINAYKRIRDAAEAGRGVRLSADECYDIWNIDDAVSQAVSSFDDPDQWGGDEENE